MSTTTTVVARVIHHLDLSGKVVGIECEPAGPVPRHDIAASAFRAGLRTQAWLAGGDTEQYRLVREIFIRQVVALVGAANEVVSQIIYAPRAEHVADRQYAAGYRAAMTTLHYGEELQRLRERCTDLRPYLQAVAQQPLFQRIDMDATAPVPAPRRAAAQIE
jgi:hypothetical protein